MDEIENKLENLKMCGNRTEEASGEHQQGCGDFFGTATGFDKAQNQTQNQGQQAGIIQQSATIVLSEAEFNEKLKLIQDKYPGNYASMFKNQYVSWNAEKSAAERELAAAKQKIPDAQKAIADESEAVSRHKDEIIRIDKELNVLYKLVSDVAKS